MPRQVDVLKVEQQAKRQSDSGGWEGQRSQASQRLLPIRRSQKRQTDRDQRNDGELKNVRAGCFVRLWPRDA